MKKLLIAALLLALNILFAGNTGKVWEVDVPENAGYDSQKLAAVGDFIKKKHRHNRLAGSGQRQDNLYIR